MRPDDSYESQNNKGDYEHRSKLYQAVQEKENVPRYRVPIHDERFQLNVTGPFWVYSKRTALGLIYATASRLILLGLHAIADILSYATAVRSSDLSAVIM